jgi:hypothetical protein
MSISGTSPPLRPPDPAQAGADSISTSSAASSPHHSSETLFSLLCKYGLVIVLLSGATLAAYFAFPSREKLPPGVYANPPVVG